MADDITNNDFEDDDFSSSFSDDDLSGTDLFGEDINSDTDQDDDSDDFELNLDDDLSSSANHGSDEDYDLENQSHSSQRFDFNNPDLKKRLVPAVVGIVVLISVIYGCYKLFFSSHSSAPTPPVATNQQAKSTPIKLNDPQTAANSIIKTSPTPPNSTDTTTTAVPSDKISKEIELPPLQLQNTAKKLQQGAQEIIKLQEAIGGLQADMKVAFENTGNNVEKIQEDVSDLQKQAIQNAQSIQALASQITTINNKVGEINENFEKLSNLIKQATPSQPRSNTPVIGANPSQNNQFQQTGGAPEQSPPAYYVQAVIPGRAWLKDSAGKIISVGIGDQVPGFGSVTQINTRAGSVHTTSGVTIEYGISQY